MKKIIIKSKDGIYTGYFKEIPHVIAEGETIEELDYNLNYMLDDFNHHLNNMQ